MFAIQVGQFDSTDVQINLQVNLLFGTIGLLAKISEHVGCWYIFGYMFGLLLWCVAILK